MEKDKNTIVTAFLSKLELKIFGVCFLIAFLMNVYAVIAYERSWVELFSQLGIVAAIAVSLYIILFVIRLIVYLIRKAFRK